MDSSTHSGFSASGFTLLEVLIVVAILAIASLVVVPTLAPTQPYSLELRATEIADAIRHARTEALRTGSPFGVYVDPALKRVRVFRDTSGALPPTPVYDVYHPITKRFYDLDLNSNPANDGLVITATNVWLGSCLDSTLLGFDAQGTPRCGNPWNVGLKAGSLTLSHEGHKRTIAIAGTTGRVTVL